MKALQIASQLKYQKVWNLCGKVFEWFTPFSDLWPILSLLLSRTYVILQKHYTTRSLSHGYLTIQKSCQKHLSGEMSHLATLSSNQKHSGHHQGASHSDVCGYAIVLDNK
jgi:hypothetical protein